MKKAGNLLWSKRTRFAVMTLVLILTLGLAMVHSSFVSHAESKGKVTASGSVNIRKEPSVSSTAVGSAEKDSVVDIKGKVTASDGTVWYQIFVDANTLGYVRSDLVQITDGTTPPTIDATTTTPTPTPATNINETPAVVTEVQPISATVVTKGQNVRVRSNASTTSSIVTSVEKGLALTVTGQANGADGKVWYRVEFISNGSNVVGFIRSDFVSLSGELVPPTQEVPNTGETPPEETPDTQTPQETKKWETQLQNEKWYILNMETGKQYIIDDLFSAMETNGQLYADSQKTVSSQKIAIIILVILLIACGAVAALLFLKLKDMADSAYFSAVERETLRRRGEARNQNKQSVVHTVGPDKKPGAKPAGTRPAGAQPQGSKPQGARPAGAQPQGNRPQGARPAGSQPQAARPQGSQPQTARPQGGQSQGARPAGSQPQAARPQGGQSQGARPAGSQPQTARPQGGQSQGARPAGSQPQAARPQGSHPQGTRPAGAQPQTARPAGAQQPNGKPVPKARPVEGQQNPGWKSKNFMTDDEFEFEFLNWDGKEE